MLLLLTLRHDEDKTSRRDDNHLDVVGGYLEDDGEAVVIEGGVVGEERPVDPRLDQVGRELLEADRLQPLDDVLVRPHFKFCQGRVSSEDLISGAEREAMVDCDYDRDGSWRIMTMMMMIIIIGIIDIDDDDWLMIDKLHLFADMVTVIRSIIVRIGMSRPT